MSSESNLFYLSFPLFTKLIHSLFDRWIRTQQSLAIVHHRRKEKRKQSMVGHWSWRGRGRGEDSITVDERGRGREKRFVHSLFHPSTYKRRRRIFVCNDHHSQQSPISSQVLTRVSRIISSVNQRIIGRYSVLCFILDERLVENFSLPVKMMIVH